MNWTEKRNGVPIFTRGVKGRLINISIAKAYGSITLPLDASDGHTNFLEIDLGVSVQDGKTLQLGDELFTTRQHVSFGAKEMLRKIAQGVRGRELSVRRRPIQNSNGLHRQQRDEIIVSRGTKGLSLMAITITAKTSSSTHAHLVVFTQEINIVLEKDNRIERTQGSGSPFRL
jgi:hypothetical protein